jgi:hypothetical protein
MSACAFFRPSAPPSSINRAISTDSLLVFSLGSNFGADTVDSWFCSLTKTSPRFALIQNGWIFCRDSMVHDRTNDAPYFAAQSKHPAEQFGFPRLCRHPPLRFQLAECIKAISNIPKVVDSSMFRFSQKGLLLLNVTKNLKQKYAYRYETKGNDRQHGYRE